MHNGQLKANLEHERKVGRSAENSGPRGDGKKCQYWYTFGELEGENSRL